MFFLIQLLTRTSTLIILLKTLLSFVKNSIVVFKTHLKWSTLTFARKDQSHYLSTTCFQIAGHGEEIRHLSFSDVFRFSEISGDVSPSKNPEKTSIFFSDKRGSFSGKYKKLFLRA